MVLQFIPETINIITSKSIVTLGLTKQIYKKKFACFNLYSKPYGITYGQWTVKWWQWVFSLPAGVNPIIDKTGKYADASQPSDNVWFLAGKFSAGEDREFPNRKCRVSSHKLYSISGNKLRSKSIRISKLENGARSNKFCFER